MKHTVMEGFGLNLTTWGFFFMVAKTIQELRLGMNSPRRGTYAVGYACLPPVFVKKTLKQFVNIVRSLVQINIGSP